jgi:UDP-N-acetyl-D-mannosaminuronic acid transferase (WecB/TagA/CpsF family)
MDVDTPEDAQRDKAPRLNVLVLGMQVTAFDLLATVAEMADAIASSRRSYACLCPVYTMMQGNERDDVRAALNGADWVTPNGMPVVRPVHGLV